MRTVTRRDGADIATVCPVSDPGRASIGEALDDLISRYRAAARTGGEDVAVRGMRALLAAQHPDAVERLLTRAICRLALVWPHPKPPPPVVLTPVGLRLGVVDRTEAPAPYRQIAAQLREAVDEGRLKPGDRLPSEADLIRHYGVSRMTIRHALDHLAQAGYTKSVQGSGVFVLDRRKGHAT